MNNYILALKKYADFNGKSSKPEFWHFILINYAIGVGLSLIGSAINTNFLGAVFSLATLVPTLAVGWRRMHDIGKEGWYFLIPLYNLYLALQPSAHEAATEQN